MSRPGCWMLAAASVMAASVPAGRASANATFKLTITDPAGEGFNDTTPATPVGGNSGTTVGEQRRIVFQRAIELWGYAIDSAVPIEVSASFAPLACSGNSAILGQARPLKSVADATGLPPGKWFPIALANAITGRDLDTAGADIQATFNGDLSCLSMDWYYGLDGNRGNGVDLLHNVLHELTHGLGFTDSTNLTTGALSQGYPTVYGTFLYDNTTQLGWASMSNAQRLAAITDVRQLVWTGTNVKTTAATYLAKGAPSLTLSPSLSGFSGFVTEANYGPYAASGTVTGVVAQATGSSNCTVSSSSALTGKVVLVTHTAYCSGITTASWVQKNGGVAAIIAYTQEDGSPPPLLIDAKSELLAKYAITIPTLAITAADAALLAGAGQTITATISGNSSQSVGTDPSGRTMMYVANPVISGSSVAHWDPLVRPDLTLEPVSTAVPAQDLTMERALLLDLGWPAGTGAGGSTGSGGSGAGGAGGSGGTVTGSGGAAVDGGTSKKDAGGGCCSVAARPSGLSGAILLLAIALLLRRRSRRGGQGLLLVALLAAPSGCDSSDAAPSQLTAQVASPAPVGGRVAPEVMRAELQRRLSRSPDNVTVRQLPGGGMIQDTGDGFHHVSVITRRPDGTFETRCVESEAEIPAIMERAQNGGAR